MVYSYTLFCKEKTDCAVVGTRDYKCLVSPGTLRYAFRYAHDPPPPVSLEYMRAAYLIMTENNITNMPSNTYEALNLYFVLTTALDLFLE